MDIRSMKGNRAMTEPEVFVLADRALNRVVGQIKDDLLGVNPQGSFLQIVGLTGREP
jgi:hypothetical protein